MTTRLRFLGGAGYEIVGPAQRILIDPFLTGNEAAPCGPGDLAVPDLILLTHAAFDHFGDAAEIALRTGAPVLCDPASRELLLDRGVPRDQVMSTVMGLCVEVAGLRIRPLESRHWSQATLSDGRMVSSYVLAYRFETEPGLSIYHYADTAYFDMSFIGELYPPTVALLGPTLPYEALAGKVPAAFRLVSGELDGDEAARVAEMVRCDLAVACHYIHPDAEVERFLQLVPTYDTSGTRRAVAPLAGDTLVVEPGGAFTLERAGG